LKQQPASHHSQRTREAEIVEEFHHHHFDIIGFNFDCLSTNPAVLPFVARADYFND